MNRDGWRLMQERCDVAIVGGGLVGLATAYQLLRRRPDLRVTVLEKESSVARHQSGHNSGVIHSGINYPPGSLKARLCIEGAWELMRFAEANDIEVHRTGKLIAAQDGEVEAMRALHARALANGLTQVRAIPQGELREREPHLRAVAALDVPQTATVDFAQVARTYADVVVAMGGTVRLGVEVLGFADTDTSTTILRTSCGEISTAVLVTCAGLQSDRLARAAGLRLPARIVPFRGSYFELSAGAAKLLSSTVYPIPDPRLPFLGVHVTRRFDGTTWAGPNAVLSLSRERYGGARMILRDTSATLSYPGFWRMAKRYWANGAQELARDHSRTLSVRALRRYLPELQSTDLKPVAEGTGIRAQALGADGSLIDDFLILEEPDKVFVLNAPSPAATASLAIGRMISGKALAHLSH